MFSEEFLLNQANFQEAPTLMKFPTCKSMSNNPLNRITNKFRTFCPTLFHSFFSCRLPFISEKKVANFRVFIAKIPGYSNWRATKWLLIDSSLFRIIDTKKHTLHFRSHWYDCMRKFAHLWELSLEHFVKRGGLVGTKWHNTQF